MKKHILAFVSLVVLISCNKKESTTNLHLTGTIKGLKKGTLYIQRVVDTNLVPIDTININGSSDFETDLFLESPEMLYVYLDRGITNSLNNNILFFAEPGVINIDANLDTFISSAKITGSKNQDIFMEYKKIDNRFRDENLDLIQQKFKAYKANNTHAVDSISAKQDNNIKRKYLFATNFALNNRESEVAPYIALSEIYDINIKYLDTIQKSMSPKVAQSLYGKKLTKFVENSRKQNKN